MIREARQCDVRDLFPQGIADVVTCGKVERRLGYPEGGAPDVIRAGIETHCARLEGLGRNARAAVRVLPLARINTMQGIVGLHEMEFACGPRITSQLEGAVELAVFLATTGAAFQEGLENATHAHDPFDHFLLDAVGSVFAEACAAALHEMVREEALLREYGTSNRYSPGYCGWSVSDQRVLFDLLAGAHCGVRLSASSMMSPIKSVSGIIGLGPGVVSLPHGCADCDSFDCMYRVESTPSTDEAESSGGRI